MIEIIYRVIIREGCEQEFTDLASSALIPEANNQTGCIVFSLFQNTANKREYIFSEKWKTEQDVIAYKQRLIVLLGASNPGEEFPKKMNDLIEQDEDLV